ncbi:gluconate 2-dehydrogenase subunit 3 family protein [Tunturibacter empetritectus]|uniref:Gluconate 2-dehydrogenase subunit 3 family protein n=1 Tax=Tunturiibacter lichenicola TaxID=2051959 RepID=A0A7W8J5E7_9BACT|nr:gluconate 2-dehydrogenase subunit 3 family protein [Edaphobacter lichenicola]MBB5342983.1 hypothetical protein [Edaphobacter lichenicola]
MSTIEEIDPSYLALIDSDRVSAQTREVLLKRLQSSDEPGRKTALSTEEKKILQALAECVVPMAGRSIDFALSIDARLAEGQGKGWRYSELPPDLTAYRGALAAIDRYARREFRTSFAELPLEKKNQTLRVIESGEMEAGEPDSGDDVPSLSATQMQRWFQDLRGDVTGIYMSHPETLAQLWYSGIADGADSAALSGFVQLGLGKVEAWEPKAKVRENES